MPYKLILNGKVIAILATCLLTVKFFVFLTGIFTGFWIGYKAEQYRAAHLAPDEETTVTTSAPAVIPVAPRAPVVSQPVVATPATPRAPQPRVSVTASNWRDTLSPTTEKDTLALDRFDSVDRSEPTTLFPEDTVARNREAEEYWPEAEEPAVVAESYDAAPEAAEPEYDPPAPEPVQPRQEFSGEEYSFQVGAFSDPRNAETMARDLRSRGYDVQVLPEPGNRKLTAVRIGHFRQREMAQQAASLFRVNEQLPAWVRRSSAVAD